MSRYFFDPHKHEKLVWLRLRRGPPWPVTLPLLTQPTLFCNPTSLGSPAPVSTRGLRAPDLGALRAAGGTEKERMAQRAGVPARLGWPGLFQRTPSLPGLTGPPPEEVKKVETAIGAAKAEASRESMLGTQANRR